MTNMDKGTGICRMTARAIIEAFPAKRETPSTITSYMLAYIHRLRYILNRENHNSFMAVAASNIYSRFFPYEEAMYVMLPSYLSKNEIKREMFIAKTSITTIRNKYKTKCIASSPLNKYFRCILYLIDVVISMVIQKWVVSYRVYTISTH